MKLHEQVNRTIQDSLKSLNKSEVTRVFRKSNMTIYKGTANVEVFYHGNLIATVEKDNFFINIGESDLWFSRTTLKKLNQLFQGLNLNQYKVFTKNFKTYVINTISDRKIKLDLNTTYNIEALLA